MGSPAHTELKSANAPKVNAAAERRTTPGNASKVTPSRRMWDRISAMTSTGNVNATVRGLTMHTATAPISHVPMQIPHSRVPTGWRERSSS
jgi:ActR/RegA family two-component response regulator